jgi:hypothetical protein
MNGACENSSKQVLPTKRLLSCRLRQMQVAWLDESSIPLTYDDRRIVDDSRFTIVRPIVREWNLQIRDVRLEDQGQYRCTVNTQPVRSKVVMLHVKGWYVAHT